MDGETAQANREVFAQSQLGVPSLAGARAIYDSKWEKKSINSHGKMAKFRVPMTLTQFQML